MKKIEVMKRLIEHEKGDKIDWWREEVSKKEIQKIDTELKENNETKKVSEWILKTFGSGTIIEQ